MSDRSSRARRRYAHPFPARTPAASAQARSRTAASCRRVQDWDRCRRWRFPAPAPCRRSGNCPARPDGSADASGRCRSCRRHRRVGFARPLLRLQPRYFSGVGDEFFAAAGRAEIIRLAVMFGAMFRRVRIDRHAADRIADLAGMRLPRSPVRRICRERMRMIVRAAAAGRLGILRLRPSCSSPSRRRLDTYTP